MSINSLQGEITLNHVLQARTFIDDNNDNKQDNNLVYYYHHANGGHFVVRFKDAPNKEYKPKELLRIAYLIYKGEKNLDRKSLLEGDQLYFSLDEYGFSGGDMANGFLEELTDTSNPEYVIHDTGAAASSPSNQKKDTLHHNIKDDEMDEDVKLLKQFKQMIFYGPPGTGKTFNAKWTLEFLFGVDEDELPNLQGDRWDIVQFHPSYNYEDFVRGVQVSTNDEGQIKYETKNRIFAEMCDKASRDEGNAYALIIDEINRANVSSVLGELIYALEYRGESVSTPYEIIGSRLLTIPPNLYIIGTMNTADRTIGALDYAVRRRFAFVHCPPDESLIKDAEAKSVFSKVKHIFADFLSPDFDAADVKIGHSYFMAAGEELRGKIQYQVIPILEEYVKDGVLLPEAKEEIKELLNEEPPGNEDTNPNPPNPNPEHRTFTWTIKDGQDVRTETNGVGRTVLSIIRDYVDNRNPPNLDNLREAFPDRLSPGRRRTVASQNDPDVLDKPRRYFMRHPISLNGENIVVCREWGATGTYWADFKNQAETLDYTITEVE